MYFSLKVHRQMVEILRCHWSDDDGCSHSRLKESSLDCRFQTHGMTEVSKCLFLARHFQEFYLSMVRVPDSRSNFLQWPAQLFAITYKTAVM